MGLGGSMVVERYTSGTPHLSVNGQDRFPCRFFLLTPHTDMLVVSVALCTFSSPEVPLTSCCLNGSQVSN